MKCMYIDGQAGAAGDMILGALIDLGLDLPTLEATLAPSVPSEFKLHVTRVSVNGIAATRLNVDVIEDSGHRHLSDVLALTEKGALSPTVRARVAGVFQRLAAAEAKVHSSSPERVHFHEVGANDAIIDVVGSIWGLEQFGIAQVYCAPLVLGSGVGNSAHGPIHYPAPAVLEILQGIPVRIETGLGETTTPTGAAILAEVANFRSPSSFIPERVGYGAGSKTLIDRPNLLRATIGESGQEFDSDTLWLGTSDIDNTRPEVFEWVGERLREAGAVDVVMLVVAMKKGRQGRRIEVLCDDTKRDTMAQIILSETGSLGIRWHQVRRSKLERRVETIETPWGPIRVKIALLSGRERGIPEYDDCRAAASKHHVPLLEIIDLTTHLYYARQSEPDNQRG